MTAWTVKARMEEEAIELTTIREELARNKAELLEASGKAAATLRLRRYGLLRREAEIQRKRKARTRARKSRANKGILGVRLFGVDL